MPIRPEDLRGTSATIAEDRACRACGYNLRGLRDDGKCPECAQSIRPPRGRPVYADQMIRAPLVWLRVYRLATLLLCVGAWVMGVALPAWAFAQHLGWGLLALGGSIVWTTGSIMATAPRPRMSTTMVDPEREWRALRLAARWTQPMWTAALGGAVVVQAMDAPGPLTLIPVGVLMMLGVMGWWPLMIVQSNLAYWSGDTDLADRLRYASWGTGIGLAIGVGVFLVIGRGWSGGVLGSTLFVSAWAGTILISLGYALVTLWQLQRMAHWLVAGRINSDMRDARLRERARLAALK